MSATIQRREQGGLNGKVGGSGENSGFWNMLQITPTGFTDGLDTGVKERGITSDSVIFGLSNWKDEVAGY